MVDVLFSSMDSRVVRRALTEIYTFPSIASGDLLDTLGGEVYAGDFALEYYMSRMKSERERKRLRRRTIAAVAISSVAIAKKNKDIDTPVEANLSG